MARVCDICGKGKQIGYNVSHAHNRTKKEWLPNLQSIRIVKDGGTKRIASAPSASRRGASKNLFKDYVLLSLSTDFTPFNFNIDFMIFCT